MTRFILFGDTGDGKTLLSVDYLKDAYDEGYVIWSNLHLKGGIEYIHVNDTAFTREVDNTKKNFILIDEVGTISRGHYTFTFNQLLAQSRKSIGEEQIFIMTTQVENQTDAIMRGLVDFFVYPNIILRHKDGKPLYMEADFYIKIKHSVPLIFTPCNKVIPSTLRKRYVYDACELYDTFEEVDAMSDGRIYGYLEQYEDYIGSKGNTKKLKAIINERHGLSLAESERTALKIIHAREYGIWDEWQAKQKVYAEKTKKDKLKL